MAVLLARHGFDDEVVAAGALHDAMEDQGVTFDELSQRFGDRVATLVRHVTEQDRAPPWEDRKRLYPLEAFPKKPWDAQAITLADKIDNFQSIIARAREHGDLVVDVQARSTSRSRGSKRRAMCRGLPPHPLLDEYGAVLDELLSTG